MIATLTTTFLTTPFILGDYIPAVDVDYAGNASCPDCGTDLGQMTTLANGWVDLNAVDNQAYQIYEDHLNSDQATRDCRN